MHILHPSFIGNPIDWHITQEFNLMKLLGKGSFGQVVEAESKALNHKVAVKRIETAYVDLVDAKRVLREMTILSSVQHKSIVAYKG